MEDKNDEELRATLTHLLEEFWEESHFSPVPPENMDESMKKILTLIYEERAKVTILNRKWRTDSLPDVHDACKGVVWLRKAPMYTNGGDHQLMGSPHYWREYERVEPGEAWMSPITLPL